MNNLLKTVMVISVLLMQLSSFAQQDADNLNTVDFPAINFKKEPVNMFVTHDNALLVTYGRSASIPKYFQFSASSNANVALTVQIAVSDNNNVQTITRDIEITDNSAFYEIPIHNYLAATFAENPDAVVKSVLFTNRSNSKIMVREANFSSISVNYPIGINQVFVLDMMNMSKRYFVHSNSYREVNINIYATNGALQKREMIILDPGDNYITLDMMRDMAPGKYVILVTDASNTNISNTMMVMY